MSSQKRIFLTGASSGIGLATAVALSQAGHAVWGTSRQAERLPADLAHFRPVALNLNGNRALEPSFNAALEEAGGRFDVLINNAGGGWLGPAAQMPANAVRNQFEIMVFGPVTLIQLTLPSMRRAPGGLVINVTSLAGRLPLPFAAAYSAAKAALSAFTATLQMEEAGVEGAHRVRFVDLQPGDINTDFNRTMQYWEEVDRDTDVGPASAAARRVLRASDQSMALAPSPDIVAARIVELVEGRGISPVVTCGNFLQARMGPLAARFLPPRLLQWTIRRHCDL